MRSVLEMTMHSWDPAFIWRGVAVKGKTLGWEFGDSHWSSSSYHLEAL